MDDVLIATDAGEPQRDFDDETVDDWTARVLGFNDFLKNGVELAVARRTACALCNGRLRPFKSALVGPGVWKCARCGNEQIVRVDTDAGTASR